MTTDLQERTLPIDAVIPYWRNPRQISEEAVEKVATSIARYGYQAPIVVDEGNVVVTGHARLMALRRLGWTEVPVLVTGLTEEEAREYRIIDNRSGEYTAWDRAKLLEELRAFTDSIVLECFFPEVDLDLDQLDLSRTLTDRPDTPWATSGNDVTCPHCYHQWTLEEEAP